MEHKVRRGCDQCKVLAAQLDETLSKLRSAEEQIEQWKCNSRENKTIAEERDRAANDALLRLASRNDLLRDAREKLKLYREAHSGEYLGGVEYTQLMQRIEKALAGEHCHQPG